MRAAVFLLVVAIHVALFLLFVVSRVPAPLRDEDLPAPSIGLLLPLQPQRTVPENAAPGPTGAHTTASRRRQRPSSAAVASAPAVNPAPQPAAPSQAVTTPEVALEPDWRHEMQIAANNEIDSEEHKRRYPSVLAPHDFSRAKPGSMDDQRPSLPWDYAATHRVEELPTGGLLINLNDRCVIVLAPLPLPMCRIGKLHPH